MQQIILVFLAAVFIIAILKQILYWSWLWQLKEYRMDRMRTHFQDIGVKSAFLAMIGYSSLRQTATPKFTVKSVLIIFFSFLAGIAILILTVQNFFPAAILNFSEILSDKKFFAENKFLLIFSITEYLALPVIIFFTVTVLNGISAIFKKRIINKAKEKVSKFPNLTVIGITGSYGKSTVKEILYQILSKSKKYSAAGGKVLKTPANINTAIGIAKLILDKLDSSYEIFIVEMGAYKIGEIKEICDMVNPKIGIITAINEQHMALFGNISNTIKAKFELFDNLPKNGTAILNIGDKNIQIGASERKGGSVNIKLYSIGAQSDYYASDISAERQTVKFKLISGQKMQDFKINMSGKRNISNAMAAIIAAENIGINLNECSQIIQRMAQFPEALKISIGPNASTLIDDTYNSNPDGVIAALDYLKNQKGKKIVIISSLIELGGAARAIHEKIGEKAASFAKEIIVLDNYYFDDILKGADKIKNSDTEIRCEKNRKKIAKQLEKELKFGDTVLFINRGAGKVLELLKK